MKLLHVPTVLPCFTIWIFLHGLSAVAEEAIAPFELALTGCAMAHCDVRMSDNVGIPPPVGDNIRVIWHQNLLPGEKAGSGGGIGCAGNGTVVACSFRGRRDNVISYDYNGRRLWTTGELLDFTARASVPMVAMDGGVVAADQYRIIRFSPRGDVLWDTPTTGGTPISPVITESGVIILAKNRGGISAYDDVTGERLAELIVKLSDNDPGSFETVNTPSVDGDRVYVTMRYQIDGTTDPNNLNRLIAMDVDRYNPNPDERLTVAWFFEFIGPSGGSPLRIGDTIYFDGDTKLPHQERTPYLYAVRDLGDQPQEIWRTEFEKPIVVSAAQDPRGGLWVFPTGKRFGDPEDYLSRLFPEPEKTGNLLRIDQNSGVVIDFLRIDDLLSGIGVDPQLHFTPTSAMMITELDAGHPVMILNVTAFSQGEAILVPLQTFIIAINLESLSLLWHVELPAPEGATFGAQFPVLERNGDRRIVFTTEYGGTWAIGQSKRR